MTETWLEHQCLLLTVLGLQRWHSPYRLVNAYLPLCLEIIIVDQWAGTKVVLGALEFLIWAHAHNVKVTYIWICEFPLHPARKILCYLLKGGSKSHVPAF